MSVTKFYRCGLKNFTLFLLVNGKTRCFRFMSVSDNSSCSEYVTNIPAEQAALEASNKFGVRYTLVRTINESAEPVAEGSVANAGTPTPTPTVKEYPHVKNIQEAIEVLSEEYAVEEESIHKKVDILREAAKRNISFPNLKK